MKKPTYAPLVSTIPIDLVDMLQHPTAKLGYICSIIGGHQSDQIRKIKSRVPGPNRLSHWAVEQDMLLRLHLSALAQAPFPFNSSPPTCLDF